MRSIDWPTVATRVVILVLFALVFKLALDKPSPITYTVIVYSPYDPTDATLMSFAGDELMCFLLDPK